MSYPKDETRTKSDQQQQSTDDQSSSNGTHNTRNRRSRETTVETKLNSSDAETDKMEGLEEKESDLERLAGETKKRKLIESHDDMDSASAAESHDEKRLKKKDADNDDGDDEDDEHEDEDDKKDEDEDEDEDQDHNDEQNEREATRLQAMEELKDIETDFARMKDTLYETQQTKLEFELKLCEADKHPDLLRYFDLINDNFQKKVEKCVNLQKYKLNSLDNQTKARRVAIHQQFLKNCQDYKTKEIVSITSNWYEINKERRNMDSMILNNPEYFQYNLSVNSKNVTQQDKINDLVIQRNSMYNELSNLKGVTKFGRGLVPSSLNNLKSCTKDEIDEDMKALGLINQG